MLRQHSIGLKECIYILYSREFAERNRIVNETSAKTFDTGEIEPGKSSKPVKFENPGEFKYHCKVHGKTMSGTVVVKAKVK